METIKKFGEFINEGNANKTLKKKALDVFMSVKSRHHYKDNKDMTVMRSAKYKVDKHGTHLLDIHGGFNGNGEWEGYLEAFLDLFKEFRRKGIDAWVIDIVADPPDDVFDTRIGIALAGETEESGDGGDEDEDENE